MTLQANSTGVVAEQGGWKLGDLSQLTICGACHELKGSWSVDDATQDAGVQRCDCERTPGPKSTRVWPKQDFDIAVELCHCCGLIPFRSGSRWSVILCDECKPLVMSLNRQFRRCVVPIGRHSMMNGVSLKGGDKRDSSVARFVDGANDLRVSLGQLSDWRRLRIGFNLGRLGFREGQAAALLDYLWRAAETSDDDLSSRAAFEALLRYFCVIAPARD